MVDQSLLDILVCPETKQSLRPAEARELDALNAAIRDGALKNRGGEVVSEEISEGLVRADGDVLYLVRDDIPIMLIDESIQLPQQA